MLPDAQPEPLDPQAVAQAICDRGLAVPAVLFLEMHRPLAHLASQFLIVGTPFLAPLLGLERFAQLRRLLAEPECYAAFIAAVEARAGAAEERA